MKRAAFTLVEILVVVAIIAVLAALTFPVYSAAKLRAKDTTCMANLRQLGVAILEYSVDHNDLLPTESSTPINPHLPHPFLTALKPYGVAFEQLKCPRDFFLDFRNGAIHWDNNHFKRCGSSYEFNIVLGKYSVSGVPNPSRNLLASDFFHFHSAPSDAEQWFNVLFFDGHVKKSDWGLRAEFAFSTAP